MYLSEKMSFNFKLKVPKVLKSVRYSLAAVNGVFLVSSLAGLEFSSLPFLTVNITGCLSIKYLHARTGFHSLVIKFEKLTLSVLYIELLTKVDIAFTSETTKRID